MAPTLRVTHLRAFTIMTVAPDRPAVEAAVERADAQLPWPRKGRLEQQQVGMA